MTESWWSRWASSESWIGPNHTDSIGGQPEETGLVGGVMVVVQGASSGAFQSTGVAVKYGTCRLRS